MILKIVKAIITPVQIFMIRRAFHIFTEKLIIEMFLRIHMNNIDVDDWYNKSALRNSVKLDFIYGEVFGKADTVSFTETMKKLKSKEFLKLTCDKSYDTFKSDLI